VARQLLRALVATSIAGITLLGAATLAPAGTANYPSSIVVIGHSGATGYDSDPLRSRWSHNSWVTGDNPAVRSLYLRILGHNPAIKGNNVNLAINGSKVASLLQQARKAAGLKPAPELVVVQSIDNDIACDGSDPQRYKPFGAAFSRAIGIVAERLPNAHIFVVSQFGSPDTNARALTTAQRKRVGGGAGPCDFLDAMGAVIPKRLAYLETVIHTYESTVATACEAFPTCRYDGGAFGRVVDRPEYISPDLSHFSVRGHAKAAAVAWSALQQVGYIPRN
jgi:hypothetical protein